MRYLVKSQRKLSHIIKASQAINGIPSNRLCECGYFLYSTDVIEICRPFKQDNSDWPTCTDCEHILLLEGRQMPFDKPAEPTLSEELERAARTINNVRNFMQAPHHFSFREYQNKTQTTAVYPGSGHNGDRGSISYLGLGLASEVGEVTDVIKKVLRDKGGVWTASMLERVYAELGDVLWYVSQLCNELSFDMGTVAEKNISKLAERKEKGELHGR